MKMEVAADQAKLALSNVGDYAGSTTLGKKEINRKPLKKCMYTNKK